MRGMAEKPVLVDMAHWSGNIGAILRDFGLSRLSGSHSPQRDGQALVSQCLVMGADGSII